MNRSKRNWSAWALSHLSLGMRMTVEINGDCDDAKQVSGRLKEIDHTGMVLETQGVSPLDFIPFSIMQGIKVLELDCPHHYPNGHGAVEPLGFPIKDFKTMRILYYDVLTEGDLPIGYCPICKTKQISNVPVEESKWYKKADEAFFAQQCDELAQQ